MYYYALNFLVFFIYNTRYIDSQLQTTKYAKVEIVPTSTTAVKGELLLEQSGNAVIINGTITGLSPGLHGFHIHEKGDLGNDCKNSGSHFNPFNVNHGSKSDSVRHVGDLGNIFADENGVAYISMVDLKISLEAKSQAYVGGLAFVLHGGADDLGQGGDQESLRTGNAGARVGCGIINMQGDEDTLHQQQAVLDNNVIAYVDILPARGYESVKGEIQITAQHGGILIEGQVDGLSPGLHGFHIHEFGDIGDNCRNAGGHFNPLKKNHGGPIDEVRHIGDLGNIIADERGIAEIKIIDQVASLDLLSQGYIGNLSIVIHGGEDDLGRGGNQESFRTGNAGVRVGCGIINVQHRDAREEEMLHKLQRAPVDPILLEHSTSASHLANKFSTVTIIPGSNNYISGFVEIFSAQNGLIYAGVISGLSPGYHGFHVHEFSDLGNKCKNAGGHFNPFNKNHGGLEDEERHVGDLGNILADENGIAVFKIYDHISSSDPLSQAYIGKKSLVIHSGADDLGKGGHPDSLKTGNAGSRDGCGFINTHDSVQLIVERGDIVPSDHNLDDIDIQDSSNINWKFSTVTIYPGVNDKITGTVEISATEGGIILEGEIKGLSPGYHGFHIHEFGDIGNKCKKAGGHFNPYNTAHGGPSDTARHVGDLGNIEADERGIATFRIFDTLASADQSSPAYIGNLALVVHSGEDDLGRGGHISSLKTGNAGSREGCGVIIVNQSAGNSRNDYARVELIEANKSGVTGIIEIHPSSQGIVIYGNISGLSPGFHGFHIHEKGDLGNECRNAGSHFNPHKKNHGAPEDIERHVGDLGNIRSDENGISTFQFTDSFASLDTFSSNYIGRLSVVVHSLADDLGKGGNPESLKTGNAGARIACGIIEHITPQMKIQFPHKQRALFVQSKAFEQAPLSGKHHLRNKRSSLFDDEFSSIFGEAHHSLELSPSSSKHFSKKIKAKVSVIPGASKSVHGKLIITQHRQGISIKGKIYGLTPGLHGFHIHEKDDLGNNCRDAGPHFNPYEKNHGDKKDKHRHVGDLGNVKANKKGVAFINIFDKKGTLEKNSKAFIGNRAIVVHADEDDLGRGNNADSKRTGNSGARVGCGVIKLESTSKSFIKPFESDFFEFGESSEIKVKKPYSPNRPKQESPFAFQDGFSSYTNFRFF